MVWGPQRLGGRFPVLQRVGQAVDRHDTATGCREEGWHCSLSGRAPTDRFATELGAQRTRDANARHAAGIHLSFAPVLWTHHEHGLSRRQLSDGRQGYAKWMPTRVQAVGRPWGLLPISASDRWSF